jgi:hypothetical protein
MRLFVFRANRTAARAARYDRGVIDPRQLVLGISIGLALIVCGLVPGLFQQVSDGVRNAIHHASAPFLAPARTREEVRQPAWLATVGAAFIAAAVLAYFSR